MKGNPQVIETLNALLTDELMAQRQYFIHGRMLHEWGLHHIGERIMHEMSDEAEHAEMLINRILFLEGVPDMTSPQVSAGTTVPEILEKDLAVERKVIVNLRKAIALCEREQDYVSRDILLKMLVDTEEDHTHWLEQQLGLIEKIGLPNYLQIQINP